MISVNPIYAAVIAAFFVVGAWVYALKNEVSNLEEKLSTCYVNLQTAKTHNILHEVSIGSQNAAIKTLEVDLNASTQKLKEWNALPPKVRYEVIYKDVVKENNLTGDCDEVKTLINSVGSINLNSL
ncbi:MAG: hypothetical protein WBK67_02395 [Minisyncoccales bacterium]